MPALKSIRSANSSVPQTSPVAVFAGATSGIGLGTIEALLQNTEAPKVLILGRSQTRFSPTLDRLGQLNPNATITFFEGQVSLLQEVDRLCAAITSEYNHIDLLWLSQGGLANADGALTSEGLNADLAISFYSRIMFVQRLISLLNASASDARVVSVLSAGEEGKLVLSDLGLQKTKHIGVFPLMKHEVTMMSLAMNQLANRNPNISFMHTFPGMVSTQVHDRWIDGWSGIWAIVGWVLRRTMLPLMQWLGSSPQEAGEVGLYELTDAAFAAQQGTNFWRLDEKADGVQPSALLQKYQDDGYGSKVLEHALDVGEKVMNQSRSQTL